LRCFLAMTITINGERRDVPDGLTVLGLVAELKLVAERIAMERNRAILPRARWEATPVEPGDEYEIVQFVGGG
jgi:thiamine biosynthesis protein ThiS